MSHEKTRFMIVLGLGIAMFMLKRVGYQVNMILSKMPHVSFGMLGISR